MNIDFVQCGNERHTIIVIDDFVTDPSHLVEDASMLAFRPIGPHYPGVRADVPPALAARFLGSITDLICESFGVCVPFEDVQCWYSLVTTPPAALAPIQRLPHFDSVDPGRIALLHYLVPGEQGGTAFFRHRTTGFESVNSDRQDVYSSAIDRDIADHGLPGPAYIAGDTPMFERIGHVQARHNRAILYRGHMLHCADIPPDMCLPANPATGRLTVNSFIHAKLRA
ncbi:MAG: hypothetical protein RL367_2316 [Pseudomonadota bacterium]|jgi:hypothetical protein